MGLDGSRSHLGPQSVPPQSRDGPTRGEQASTHPRTCRVHSGCLRPHTAPPRHWGPRGFHPGSGSSEFYCWWEWKRGPGSRRWLTCSNPACERRHTVSGRPALGMRRVALGWSASWPSSQGSPHSPWGQHLTAQHFWHQIAALWQMVQMATIVHSLQSLWHCDPATHSTRG